MNKILSKKTICENVIEYKILAPDVSKHARAGQFIILRVDSEGERVPFTIYDYDKEQGTITILVQTVGATTYELSLLKEGDSVHDFVGPLGNATDIDWAKKALLVGGGIGSAVIFPQAKHLQSIGCDVDVVLGARDISLVIAKDEFEKHSNSLHIATDNGSYGVKGFVTDIIKRLLDEGNKYDIVFAVGPLQMMRAVCNVTKPFGVHTIVSMNSIMVDGTGMCGGCRISVDGKVKYACVDGPEFDGHKVDFDEAINRSKIYKEQESCSYCNIKQG